MGGELASACVFCASLLFGMGAPVWPGVSAEIGVTYATAARGIDLGEGRGDLADVTPKFVLVGAGGARPAAGELGAGTPAAEWRIRVALGPSHDEQTQTPYSTSNVTATGTGRYENFAILLRYGLGSRDSIEGAWERRTHKGTDLVNLGGERFTLSEQRTINAERIDVGLGWRHRWPGFEAAANLRYARPNGSIGAAGAFLLGGSSIYGGGIDLRARRGRWTLWAGAERASGSIRLHEESSPDFVSRNTTPRAVLEAYRVGALWTAGRTEVTVSGTLDRSELPWVFVAPTGTETVAFEQGFHPESRSRQIFAEVAARHAITRAVRVGFFLRMGYGDETVTLTDATGQRAPRRLDVNRSGVFGSGLSRAIGSPEVTLGIGADFKLDTSR